MRIPIAIRGGFDKKKLPSRSESSENIQLNKLGFVYPTVGASFHAHPLVILSR